MRFTLLLIYSFCLLCGTSAQKPTKEDITKTLKAKWEREATTLNPKVTLTINDIKIGTSSKANLEQEFEGVPKSAMVTSAKIDFTQNSIYNTGTEKVRRITTAWVYKDQFGEWALKTFNTSYPDK